MEDRAYEFYHSTTQQAAQIALQANVKKLCITHISSRFECDQWSMLENEAREIFPNTVIATDFKKISIP